MFLDSLDHASLIDGARLGFGTLRKFRHNDMADLDKKLARTEEHHGKLIAVDGVFSMEGDLTDLPGVVSQAKKHSARLLVDDAHGIGVFGDHGRGVAEHFGLEADVDLVMGTLLEVAGSDRRLRSRKPKRSSISCATTLVPKYSPRRHRRLRSGPCSQR